MTDFPNAPDEADEAIDRDSAINLSMGEAEILPPIKYPEFMALAASEQIEILSYEVVINQGVVPVEVLVRDLGIPPARYKELINDEQYATLVSKKSVNHLLVPKLPKIIDQVGTDAEDGKADKVKLALQLTKSLGPEVAIQQNIYGDMSDKELRQEMRRLTKRMEDEDE